MQLLTIRDFILVTKEAEESVSPGGILLAPSSADDKIIKGKVVSTGSGQLSSSGQSVPLEVLASDVVVFNKSLAVEYKHEGKTFFILREENVLAVLR